MQNVRLVLRVASLEELASQANKEYVRFMFYLNEHGDIRPYQLARSVRMWETHER